MSQAITEKDSMPIKMYRIRIHAWAASNEKDLAVSVRKADETIEPLIVGYIDYDEAEQLADDLLALIQDHKRTGKEVLDDFEAK